MVDTAGLTDTDDVVEAIGVDRAMAAIESADVLVWLADEPPPRKDGLWVHARSDVAGREVMPAGRVAMVRHDRPETVEALWWLIEDRAKALLPRADALPLRERHRSRCRAAATALVTTPTDPLLVGEHLRDARGSLASVIGVDATEMMLDALFSRFCLGK